MVVALVTSYGISRSVNNSNAALSDLTLANLEALADGEVFNGYFNGQYWSSKYNYGDAFLFYNYRYSGDFTPKLKPCTIHSGGEVIRISYEEKMTGFKAEAEFHSPTSTYSGAKITCVRGFGNCWNGTDCIDS
ncbi:NVEALA domain-containing protein [Capnocytophaga canis]|uniref:NVEALA domain-containing protein n=1 Tax=Capnocytophaga canis TaxID=1848903 RepID=UPI001562A915